MVEVYSKETIASSGLQGLCVNSRETYESLPLKTKYSSWIQSQIEKLNLVEGKDYVRLKSDSSRGRPRVDYIVTSQTNSLLVASSSTPVGVDMLKGLIEKESDQAWALKEISSVSINLNIPLGSFDGESLIVTSKDLAKVVKKAHRNVLRDIRREISALQEDLRKLDLLNPEQIKYAQYMTKSLRGFRESSYKDDMGREQTEFIMDKVAVSQLVLRYSPAFRSYVLGVLFEFESNLNAYLRAKVAGDILPTSHSKQQYVYIIKNTETGRVKVGVGTDPVKRLKQLQTGNDCPLELVYTSFLCSNAFSVEAEVHHRFQDKLVRGEWFDVSEKEIIRFMETCKFTLSVDFQSSFEDSTLKLLNAPVCTHGGTCHEK